MKIFKLMQVVTSMYLLLLSTQTYGQLKGITLKPDLIVINQTINPTSVEAGGSLYPTASVKNQGSVTASSSYLGYYLSTNATFTKGVDTYLGNRYVGSISAGGTNYPPRTLSSVTIPANTQPGTYYLLFVADYQTTVSETNESNNVAYRQFTVTSSASLPDLTVTDQNIVQSTAEAGGSLDVSCWVRNIGGEKTKKATQLRYYLARFSFKSSTDIYLGSEDVNQLNPNGAVYHDATLNIPEGTSTAYRYVLFIADYNNLEPEASESNNLAYDSFTVKSSQAPTVPQNLTFSNLSATSLKLNWSASSDNVGVTGYKVYQDGVLLSTGLEGSNPPTFYTVGGLSPLTSYQFKVSAIDAAGNESVLSTALDVITPNDTDAPNKPTGLTASSNNITETTIKLTWNIPYDNVGVTSYQIFKKSGSNFYQIGTSTVNSYDVTGLTPNTSYTFYVKAKDAAGNTSVQSDQKTVTTKADNSAPSVPQNLSVTNPTMSQLIVTWASSTDNVGVSSYKVYVYQGSSFIKSVVTSGISSVIYDLDPATTYTFKVTARDISGNESAQSAAAQGTTLSDTQAPSPAPVLSTSGKTETTINLSWSASVDNVSSVSYKIYNGGQEVAGPTANTSIILSNLVPATNYNLSVRAYDDAGNYAASNTLNITTNAITTPAQPILVGACEGVGGFLKRDQNQDNPNYTYYWQTSQTGQSESHSSIEYYPETTGTYFIRAKYGVHWSIASSGVNVTIDNAGPTGLANLPNNNTVAIGSRNVDTTPNNMGNYMRTYTVRQEGITDPNSLNSSTLKEVAQISSQYVDGLGNIIQTVTKGGSSDGFDLVQPVVYDALGRQSRTYMPYAATSTNGGYQQDALTDQYQFYKTQSGIANSAYAYSEKVYDGSPHSKVVAAFEAGESWVGTKGSANERKTTINTRPSKNGEVYDWIINSNGIPEIRSYRPDLYSWANTEGVASTYSWILELGNGLTESDRVHTSFPFDGNTVVPQSGTNFLQLHNAQYHLDIQGASQHDYTISFWVYGHGKVKVLVDNPEESDNMEFTSDENAWQYVQFEIDGSKSFQPGELYVTALPGSSENFFIDNVWLTNPRNDENYQFKGAALVKETTDEHGIKSLEFTNNLDQVILKKVQDGGTESEPTYAETYYIYDGIGNLRYVLPPQFMKEFSVGMNITNLLNDYAFQYKYDHWKRQISKKVPGTNNWTEMVYDRMDRLVLRRDAEQEGAETDEWSFTKYDVYNRPVMTGLVYISKSDNTVEGLRNTYMDASRTNISEERTGATYSNLALPVITSNDKILSITYYDTYDFKDDNSSYEYDSSNDHLFNNAPKVFKSVRSKMTGSKVRVLESDTWLTSVSFYDENYFVIQAQSDNHKGGKDILTTAYNFTGKVTQTVLDHQVTNQNKLIVEKYTYDHLDKLKTVSVKIDDQEEVLLSHINYNKLGKIAQKNLGGSLQQVDYKYNIRGWLTDINDVNASNTDDIFNMQLSYDQGFDMAQYNGNIAGQKWKTVSDNVIRSFGYQYDQLSRVTRADYAALNNSNQWNGEEDNRYSVFGISYDKNGNITNLSRQGLRNVTEAGDKEFGAMDKLHYVYDANKLIAVDDNVFTSGVAKDFNDKSVKYCESNNSEYDYNKNGSLKRDDNKGIINIQYNHLNLPKLIDFGSDKSITYVYNATGVKLQKIVNNNGDIKTTDYIGKLVYKNNELQFLKTEEGRAVTKKVDDAVVDSNLDFEYIIKDHLGNARVSTSEKVYIASMETGKSVSEELLFGQVSETRQTGAGIGNNGSGAASLMSAQNADGLAKTIKVNTGDVVKAKVYVRTEAGGSGNRTGRTSSLLNMRNNTKEGGSNISATLLGINTQGTEPNTDQAVHIKMDFFPENGQQSFYNNAIAEADLTGIYEDFTLELEITEPGELTIRLENLTDVEVLLDDFEIRHHQKIVQENHYYAFGQELEGIGVKGDNKFTYNGIENDDEFNLNVYSAKFRTLDPQTGRWWQVDPEVESFYEFTPYNSNENNPIINKDPEGNCPSCVGAAVGAGTDALFQLVEIGLSDEKTLDDFSWTSVAISGVAGAVGVGLVDKLKKAKTLVRLTVEVVTDASASAGTQYAKDGKVEPLKVVTDVVAGQTVGKYVGDKMQKAQELKNVEKYGKKIKELNNAILGKSKKMTKAQGKAQMDKLKKKMSDSEKARAASASVASSGSAGELVEKTILPDDEEEKNANNQ